MTQPSADPLVGTTVAHYEILAKIGGGGMGVVYSARDLKLGRTVALKFLPPQWSHDESAKQRFIREAQAASATDHPNICTIHDIAAAADGRLFLVMAHYEGQTLKQKVETGPLEIEAAIEIAAQVAEGLTKAHAQGIVHRDIKPGNLMVCDEAVKILDFGLAKFANSLQLTVEGSTLGTAAYMSPEQVRGEEADARSDVWSVGVVLYEMLAGRVPFSGGYAEAVAYAIKNESPVPLRTIRPEVPEALEQLVFRALHKEPAVRYQSARDLARALRMLQGRTIAQDLLTEPLPNVRRAALPLPPRARRRWGRRAAIAAGLLAVVVVGTPLWLFAPVERVPVAIVPVVNQTGFAELDPYRLALTQELVASLADAPGIRVVAYDRLLEIVRRFTRDGGDVSSREAMQALAAQSGARVLIVPILAYENGAWTARFERRDPETANTATPYVTPPRVSSLMKDAVYGLMPELASGITTHFTEAGPPRARLAAALRNLAAGGPPPRPRLRTLDAAAAFERGLNAFEQLELSAARAAFAAAAQADPRHPLPLAWRSRVEGLMRQDQGAAEAADLASRLPADQSPLRDRLFVEAVIAESRRDSTVAEANYRELIGLFPDEPSWLLELAGLQDRAGTPAAAVTTYHQALALDRRLVRPHLELCKLYSPSRLNEATLAKTQGEEALAGYRTLGNRGGEAQALWCLTDVLRAGTEADRVEARRIAEAALQIMETLQYPYGVARAYNYIGVVALLAERDGPRAVAFFEKALAGTRREGNRFLESRTLMNLGVSSELFGNRTSAVKYYQESFAMFEAMGNQQEAAWNQVNAAGILIDYAGAADQGLRDAQNALVVFQKLGDKYFEVFARRVIALHYRYAGRPEDALRELTLAQSIARERGLADRLTQVTLDLARLRFDEADYAGARVLLLDALRGASGTDGVHARIELARTLGRLGDLAAAEREIDQAAADVTRSNDVGSRPLLYTAQGELAYSGGRMADARAHFERAAALWTDELPEASSVEARAYLGLIQALQGDGARGLASVQASLDQAQRMRRVGLEVQCRIFLARILAGAGKSAEAARMLDVITPQAEAAIGPDLRAQLLQWRNRVQGG